MAYSYTVKTPKGDIYVADNYQGDQIMFKLYKQYGNLDVLVYDRNDIFGKDRKEVKPQLITTIQDLYEDFY